MATPESRRLELTGTDDASAREVLRRLDLAVNRRLDGLLHGDHRGLTPGHGSDLGEAREYVLGDDVRRIDWNVTARLQTPYVRESISDRELETWLLVDRSASLDFGTAQAEKRDLALAAAAAVSFLTNRVGNRLGAMIIDGNGLTELPARHGRPHVMAILHRLQRTERDTGRADLAAGLRRLTAPRHRRGLAVVISDLLGGDWADDLKRVSLHHETVVIEIIDPRELELPNVGTIWVRDIETGRSREVNTGSARLRADFAEAARAQRKENAAAVRAARAAHLVLRTDRDWLFDVVAFVAKRRERVHYHEAVR